MNMADENKPSSLELSCRNSPTPCHKRTSLFLTTWKISSWHIQHHRTEICLDMKHLESHISTLELTLMLSNRINSCHPFFNEQSPLEFSKMASKSFKDDILMPNDTGWLESTGLAKVVCHLRPYHPYIISHIIFFVPFPPFMCVSTPSSWKKTSPAPNYKKRDAFFL